MSNVTDLPTNDSRGALRRAGGLVAKDDEPRPDRAAPADGGERAESRLGRVEGLAADPRQRRGSFGEAVGRDQIGGSVDEFAGGVGPARHQRGALGHRCEVGAADHEPLDAARRLAAAPAAAVVAPEDGALGQRADLFLQGQRRIDGPGHGAAVAARADRLCRGGAQTVGAECHDGQRGGVRVHHRHRIGVPDGALRSPQRHRPFPRRGDQVGADGERVGDRYFDFHPVTLIGGIK